MFGEDFVEIVLTGDTYDACQKQAIKAAKKEGKTFIHPFDDKEVIEGQATVALEILEHTSAPLDYIFVPVGGGGLISGITTVLKSHSPKTKIIGVEPKGAPSMQQALVSGERIALKKMDRFVDGAAVRQVELFLTRFVNHLLKKSSLYMKGKYVKPYSTYTTKKV